MATLSRRAFLAAGPACAVSHGASTELPETLAEAIRWVRTRRVSPLELTRATLAVIERLNPQLNAFITVLAEQALREAQQRPTVNGGSLHGIPIAVKDLFDTAGVRTTAGSAQWATRIPGEDAAVVTRLRRAGAILVGKLNLDEFAYNFTSSTSHFGLIRNPWNTSCTPGGSSGGSAVAVASGMCTATLGSDTGGSIRLPAALCGVTGFKPSFGAIDTAGGAPLAWSLDHAGPLTRTAEDAAIVFNALRDTPIAQTPPLRSVRVGVARTYFAGLEEDVARAVEAALADLGKLTAGPPHDAPLPALAPFPALAVLPNDYGAVIVAEAHAFHQEMLHASPEKYHPDTRRSIEGGASITVPEYLRARRAMERHRAGARRELFNNVDLLALPTAPGVAFPFERPADLVYLRNVAPWNLYWCPAISIPCGFSRGGLPVGLQLVGAPGADDLVLAVAQAYQRTTDWHRRRPPVSAASGLSVS
ncbi:MAG: amidase [Bryobacterales bacterium]|nr:amidase [Bryobacterales bacterium]